MKIKNTEICSVCLTLNILKTYKFIKNIFTNQNINNFKKINNRERVFSVDLKISKVLKVKIF